MMKRIISVLSITAIMLMILVSSFALPALAQDDSEEPREPRCDWYYDEDEDWDPWWEYWCRYPGWGWEFVFWTWA